MIRRELKQAIIDWYRAKQALGTLRDVCAKHHVSESTALTWCREERHRARLRLIGEQQQLPLRYAHEERRSQQR
jgi:hypothetical protein